MASAQYATALQLQAYVGQGTVLPAQPEQDRLLQRASDLLDGFITTWRYRVDPVTFLPTDQQVIDCFADCVSAQVEWWMATQDEIGQMERYESSSFEGVALSRGGMEAKRLCPRARDRLRATPAQYLQPGPVVA